MPAAATFPFLPATASVGDPSATRTVYITVVLLVVLAVAFAVLAVWLFRRTRPEPQLLAPLEEMDSRAWRRQDPAGQRRALDASRPPGARPVHREAAEPAVDTEFATQRPVQSFDDLSDNPASNGLAAEGGEEDDADRLNGGDDVHDADSEDDGGDDGDGADEGGDRDERRVTAESAITVERTDTDADAATDCDEAPTGDLDVPDDDETVDFEVPDDDQDHIHDDETVDDETVDHERSVDAAQGLPGDGVVGRTRSP